MWRPRDRERYIGSYDPEHEMPDPDRGAGDRWQSDAYRRGARDTRFMYRADPNRFENRFNDQRDYEPEYDSRWRRDARDMDRGGYGRGGYDANFGAGGYRDYGYRPARPDYDRGYDFDRGYDYDRGNDYDRGYDNDRGYSSSGWDRGGPFDRDRFYGSDRGWDSRDRDDRWRGRR